MPRINPTVTKQAEDIYNALPHHRRGEFVSDAIIEKHSRDTGTDIEARLQAVERWIERWEKEGKG